MYNDLTPQKLFTEQKGAYLKGDMKKVKEMAKVASSKLPVKGNWKEAKNILNETSFPDDINGWKKGSATHIIPKTTKTHKVVVYQKPIKSISNYEVTAKYTYCKSCREVKNKYLMIFNNEENEFHDKWFIENGEKPGNDTLQTAGRIFAMIVLLLAL